MPTVRPFCYNLHTNPSISGTEQVGDIAAVIGNATIDPSLQWWNGPDEDLGYVICYVDPTGDHPNAPERVLGTNYVCNLGFLRTGTHSDVEFIKLARKVTGNNSLVTSTQAKTELNNLGYWTSYGAVPAGMVLFLDAGDSNSYPGTGTTWYDLSGNNNDGTINGATYSPEQGGVLGFDGSNDYVSFNTTNNIPIGNENYTVSIWFNTFSSNTSGGFFGWGNYGVTNQVNAFRLLSNSQGFVNYWWANDQNFFTTVNTNTWYNVIAKFDGVNREIWLNNVLVGSVSPNPGHDVPFSSNLTIGLTAPFLNEYFPGKIGQVIFYKRGATVAEIQSIWDSGKSRFGYTPTPILSLDAGDVSSYPGSGTIWTDTVGGLTFSLINGPVYDSGGGGNIFFSAGGGVGQSDYAECQTSLPSLPAYTISVWHKYQNSLGSLPAIITEIQSGTGSINYKLGNITSGGFVQAGYFSNNSWRNTTTPPNSIDIVDKWSHILMTVDSNQNLKLYVNNVLVQSITFTGEIPTSSGQGIRLMKNHKVIEETWGGYLAKVDIYNRELNTTEISDIWELNRDRFGI